MLARSVGAALLLLTVLAVAPVGAVDLACPREAIEGDRTVDRPQIVSVHPNPATAGNVGEAVTVAVPPGTNLSGLALTDGHSTAPLPERVHAGPLALSLDPNETAEMTDDPVAGLSGYLQLANGGDTVELLREGRVVDSVRYGEAPSAKRWYRTGPGETAGTWWPRGATCEPPLEVGSTSGTAFVLPDGPDVPLETIESASDRLLVGGYEFTSTATADAIVAAVDRGVDVEVLLEGSPVSGHPRGTDALIERLQDGGATVRLIGTHEGRYRFHHPKYLVADDTALVMTENWKPAGVGGTSSRGWGIRLESSQLADGLASIFRADYHGWDTVAASPGSGSLPPTPPAPFEPNHPPEAVTVDGAELLVAPDNAEPRLVSLIREAEESLRIIQVSIGSAGFSLLEEAVAAARRGVEVRILLDASSYVIEDNQQLVDELTRIADREGLDLQASLIEPAGRFEKIHAKGLVIDDDVAVVGSANWNPSSVGRNREVLLVLHGTDVASYFATVFDADWGGGGWSMPVGLALAVVVALAGAAALAGRHLELDGHASE